MCSVFRDDHVSRDDMTPMVKEKFQRLLIENANEAIKKGIALFIHRGIEISDTQHTGQLVERLALTCPLESKRLQIIEHPDCDHHQIAVHLKQKGQLLDAISNCLILNEMYVFSL